MKKLISNEHSMNSNEIVALSMLKLYFTSVETEIQKQWKQRVMKCENEEILIDGNSLLTLLESAKCYAVLPIMKFINGKPLLKTQINVPIAALAKKRNLVMQNYCNTILL